MQLMADLGGPVADYDDNYPKVDYSYNLADTSLPESDFVVAENLSLRYF